MKVLVCGDPHLGLGSVNSEQRRATFDVIEEAVDYFEAHYMCHTGDFCDGPLSKPNFDTNTHEELYNLFNSSRSTILKGPNGNHDLPKHRYEGYTTAWENIWYSIGTSGHTTQVLFLDYQPSGQDAAEKEFFSKLGSLESINPSHHENKLLIIAHMLWEGTHEYNSNSLPQQENWFQSSWVTEAKIIALEAGYDGITIILGHDHEPANREVDGVKVITVGSPTAMKFGDDSPRRFVIWDSETNEVEYIPVTKGIRQIAVQSDVLTEDLKIQLEEKAKNGERIKYSGSPASTNEAEEVREFLAHLRNTYEIEVKDMTRLVLSSEGEEAKIMNIEQGLLVAYSEYEQDPEVRSEALELLMELGVV